MPALYGYDNLVLSGAVSAEAEVAGLGAGNLATAQGATSTSWQSPLGITAAWLQVDAGAAASWRAFGLFRSNLTGAATMRWRLSNAADMSSPVHDSGVIAAGVAAGYGQALYLLGAAETARYCRVDLDDASNPEACLRVGMMFAGPVFEPARHFDPRATALRRAPAFSTATTRGGQEFPELLHTRRAWRVVQPFVTQTEAMASLMEMQRIAEDGRNVLFVPLLSSAQVAREAVFGLLADAGDVPWSAEARLLRSWSATILERL